MSAPAGDGRDPWLSIELRHLAALSAIAHEGTFSDAALSLGYVQSAVSGQLATLERLIGTRLVERGRGASRQKLTLAGDVLLAHSNDILAELQAARQGLEEPLEPEPPAPDGLRVILTESLPDRAVGRLLSSVLSDAASPRLAGLATCSPQEAADALLEHEADIVLTSEPLHDDRLANAEITRQPPVLVVRADSTLARRRRAPTLAELSGLSLVAWREGGDPSRIEAELAERGLRANVAARADGSDTVAALVRSGLGAAVLPGVAIPDGGVLRRLELQDELPSRTVGLAWLRERSAEPALRGFVDRACRLRGEL